MDTNSLRIITGQEVKPDDSAFAKEKRNFESRWDRAYSTIYLSIEKEYRNFISDTCDPTVAWKKLQDHFQPHTRARIIGLLGEFFNCRILEEEDIGLYAARLRTVFQLSSQNESIRGISKLKSINVDCEDCKIAYGGVPKQLRNKFSMKAKKGIIVGYAMQTKGYRVWIPEEKVIETCNVSFNESIKGEAVLGINNKSEYTPLITEESESDEYESKTEIGEGDEIPNENLTWIRRAVPRLDGTRVDIYYGFEGRSLRLRSYRDVEKYCRAHNIKFNKNFFNFSRKDIYSGPVPKGESSTSEYNNHEANHVEVVIPQNFKEVSLSPDKDRWFVAMKEEINIMSERCVWELAPRPEKEKVIENSRTKHIEIKHHFLRNLVYERLFVLNNICSKNNLADVFTKPLSKFKLYKFLKLVFVNV
ncbi:copia protein [Trichonephila clavipes]|nr:copia protein [Trichonephila clavipes]